MTETKLDVKKINLSPESENSDCLKAYAGSESIYGFPSLAVTALSAATLTACGGGSSAVQPPLNEPLPPLPEDDEPLPVWPTPSQAQAAAFLAQAGFGGDIDEVDKVVALGFEGWLDEQINVHGIEGIDDANWAVRSLRNFHYGGNDTIYGAYHPPLWASYMRSPDQLRLRMQFAFSQIMVVSAMGLSTPQHHYEIASYADVLRRHSLGNFRDLLEAVTLNPAMGEYLNMRGSAKSDGIRQPDENFAREVMQLFTIGLIKLNQDGTPLLENGEPVPAYSEEDVQGLAAALTGWEWTSAEDPNPTKKFSQRAYKRTVPMVHISSRHSTLEKKFLGCTVPENTDGPTSLNSVIDTLFHHPNVPPFIALRLIQRLVTSNPTPAYIKYVAAVFVDNGKKIRGDLGAVAKAILLHPEARIQSSGLPIIHRGKLREPVCRIMQLGRIFNLNSSNGWNASQSPEGLGQWLFNAPSVFNFYTYDFKPINTAISRANLVAPEFNIASEPHLIDYVNYLEKFIGGNQDDSLVRGLIWDFTKYEAVAGTAKELVRVLDLLMTGSTLSSNTRSTIEAAVRSFGSTSRVQRIQTAALLIMACPEYLVQKN